MEQQQACQSCGMPLHGTEQLGTKEDGSKHAEYCLYCYEQGAFKQPDLTIDQMVEICVPFMVEEGMEEGKAREMMVHYLPTLKRWSKVETA